MPSFAFLLCGFFIPFHVRGSRTRFVSTDLDSKSVSDKLPVVQIRENACGPTTVHNVLSLCPHVGNRSLRTVFSFFGDNYNGSKPTTFYQVINALKEGGLQAEAKSAWPYIDRKLKRNQRANRLQFVVMSIRPKQNSSVLHYVLVAPRHTIPKEVCLGYSDDKWFVLDPWQKFVSGRRYYNKRSNGTKMPIEDMAKIAVRPLAFSEYIQKEFGISDLSTLKKAKRGEMGVVEGVIADCLTMR
eukprot:TRINITY_DN68081_c0_g1_i1.p1 TRINITY_DN68081_c0_g1~~TRINITY_DN68081_c0_g1_i1.p1  ORF type:complete len:242 (-),score=9.53 TRINITY_DN68081_c0_g1_i1:138-863(-)